MNSKMIIYSFITGIAFFLFAYLVYVFFPKDGFMDLSGGATGVIRNEGEIIWWAFIVSSLGFGFAITYVLRKWFDVNTLIGGMKAAALVAFLFELGSNLSWYSGSKLMNINGLVIKVVVFTLISAVAGGILGLYLGRTHSTKSDVISFKSKTTNINTLIAAMVGGISSLLIAWLLYALLFAKAMSGMMGSAQNLSKSPTEMNWLALILANFILNYLVAWLFSKSSNVRTFAAGAIAGAVMGLFFTTGYDMIVLAMTNVMTLNGVLLEITLSIVVWAFSAGVVSWWLGRV